MKIAMPISQRMLSSHFGHCADFVIVEVDKENRKVLSKAMLQPPAHEPGSIPRWLHENGADIIIAGGMGKHAEAFFDEFDIEVVIGAPAEAPERVIADYLNGRLETGSNTCDH